MHFDNLAGYFNVMPTTEEQIVLPIWVSLKLEIMKDKTLVYKNWKDMVVLSFFYILKALN